MSTSTHPRIRRIPAGRRGAPLRDVRIVLDSEQYDVFRHFANTSRGFHDRFEREVDSGEVLLQSRRPRVRKAELESLFPGKSATISVPNGYFIR